MSSMARHIARSSAQGRERTAACAEPEEQVQSQQKLAMADEGPCPKPGAKAGTVSLPAWQAHHCHVHLPGRKGNMLRAVLMS